MAYRTAERPSAAERAPDEIVCVAPPVDGGGFVLPVVVAIFLPITAAIGGSLLVGPMAGLVGLVGGAAGGVAIYRRRPNHDVVVRIHDGLVTLHAKRGRAELSSVRLEDVADVTLDTEARVRIEDGTSAETALHALGARRTGVTRARPVLVRREGAPITVGTLPLPHLQATEWLGKIRSFLRKHAWVPDDERAPVSSRAPSSREPS